MKALLLLPCQERAISKRKRKRQAANDDDCPPSPAAVPPTQPAVPCRPAAYCLRLWLKQCGPSRCMPSLWDECIHVPDHSCGPDPFCACSQ